MSEAMQRLMPAILALPAEDRARLRDLVNESLGEGEPDFPPEVVAEWDRRVRAADDGSEPWLDGDEVLRELREEYP